MPTSSTSPFPSRTRTFVREILRFGTLVLGVTFARSSLADHYVVPSGSMEPTVHTGDRIVVDKRAYALRLPLTQVALARTGTVARGDVIVLASPENGIVLLKRVVAVAGDDVEVRDGHVLRNGVPDDVAPADLGLDRGGGPDFGPARVPAGSILVLGDHRGDSHDGRAFGWVTTDAVLGRAVAVVERDAAWTWRTLGSRSGRP
ncbi:MAG: signal peptidase I [Polyangiaceae bacterium]